MSLDDESTVQYSDASAVAAADNQLSLLVYHRSGAEIIPLYPDTPLILGRSSQADISIPDRTLSREHARFELTNGQIWISDLGSKNGVTVNGKRAEKHQLRPNDEIGLGTVKVVVHALEQSNNSEQGMESHDGLVRALESEIVRARSFGRNLCLLALSSENSVDDHVSLWCAELRKLLRPVDRLAVYGPKTVEVFMPEITPLEAHQYGKKLIRCRGQSEPVLHLGIAGYPNMATSAEEIVEMAHRALKRATPEDPIQLAASRGTDMHAAVQTPPPAGEEKTLVISASMKKLYHDAERVARSELPVLILGETGTGKEVLARAIHDKSERRDKLMQCINCGAIPSQLIESILFGHERGAFTGAVERRKGVFEEAAGGSVLLDEVGELPLEAQVALLRFLETKRLRRVGSNQEVKVDVRIMAATHRDLESMVSEGKFREDLLYRLNTITFKIPPLRERPEEILPLATSFIVSGCQLHGVSAKRIDPDVSQALLRYRWPGNVRELRNVIERAVVIAQGDIVTVSDLSDRVREATSKRVQLADYGARSEVDTSVLAMDSQTQRRLTAEMLPPEPSRVSRKEVDFRAEILEFERSLILSALKLAEGNKAGAARHLQIPLRTLLNKLDGYKITDDEIAKAADSSLVDGAEQVPFWTRIERKEQELIQEALRLNKGNKAAAARSLHMPLRTFLSKLIQKTNG